MSAEHDEPDLDQQLEKVSEGLGPSEQTSYGPAEPGQDAKERARREQERIEQTKLDDDSGDAA